MLKFVHGRADTATMNPNYQQGDRIEYYTYGDRPEDLRRVRVVWRTDDIKHGRPGFVGEIMGGPGDGSKVWGYDDQIISTEGTAT